MKLVQSLVIAAALAIPAVASFAQSSPSISRAEVKAELVELQKAGYNPVADRTQYPRNIQAAQARLNAETGSVSAYGGVADTVSGSGAPVRTVSASDPREMYGRR